MAGRASFSSSSSLNSGRKYDVFLNFRGQDTRYGFTGNLYKALIQSGITTFFDDGELQRGDEIISSLQKALKESRIAIPIFSRNYASSAFCLDELVNIIDYFRAKHLLVFPVFYDVHPSYVRQQRGSYGEALAKHVERFSKYDKEKLEDNMERLKKWKMALKEAASLSGEHFKLGDEYEHEFIGKIVKVVSNKINPAPLHVADYPSYVHILNRVVTFASTVVGLCCYALSSSFNHIFGEWNLLKIFLYSVFSIIICLAMLFGTAWQHLTSLRFNAYLAFLVLAITSVYSFFLDKAVNGKPDAYILISCAAFAIMSLSLSKQIHCGFEVDLLYFFLGCLIIQLMKIKLLLAIVGVGFSYFLIILRSYLDAPSETKYLGPQEYLGPQDHLIIQVDSQQLNIDSTAPIMTQVHSQQVNIDSTAPIMSQVDSQQVDTDSTAPIMTQVDSQQVDTDSTAPIMTQVDSQQVHTDSTAPIMTQVDSQQVDTDSTAPIMTQVDSQQVNTDSTAPIMTLDAA